MSGPAHPSRDAPYGELLADMVRAFGAPGAEAAVVERFTADIARLFAADDAAVALADDSGDLAVAAATSADAHVLTLMQVRTGAGPAAHAYLTGEVVVCLDPSETARRWRGWAAEAQHRDRASVMAAPLRGPAGALGVLFATARPALAFTVDDVRMLQGLADTAALLLLARREHGASRALAEQLQEALQSRVVVEQAKGIVAEQLRTTPEEAFVLIRRHARGTNTTLRSTAESIVAGGLRLDPPAPRTPPAARGHTALREHAADRRDQAAEVREERADARERAADGRDAAADARDAAADARDAAADARDVVAGRREAELERREALLDALLRAGDRRDGAASSRDRAARQRDAAAEDRDDVARQREAGGGPDRDGGAADRTAAARDRRSAALDRDWSGRDRDAAAGDRADLTALVRADDPD